MRTDSDGGRAVVSGAFAVLEAIRRLGDANAMEIVRSTELPRTTVRRLLGQLEAVGAVERVATRWQIGPTMLGFGPAFLGEPRLAIVARRALIDLARATGEQAGITVASNMGNYVLDVIPGERHRGVMGVDSGDFETTIAARMGMDASLFASYRAVRRARIGSDQPAIDTGDNGELARCVAVPLGLRSGRGAAVWTMVPGAQVRSSVIETTRRAALSIAAQLPRPNPFRGGH